MMWWLFVSLSLAGLEVSDPPVQDVDNRITLVADDGRPVVGVSISVIHRPDLAGEEHVSLGLTDSLGRVRWTPVRPGVAKIRAGQERLSVRIAWSGVPISIASHLGVLGVGSILAIAAGLRRRRSP